MIKGCFIDLNTREVISTIEIKDIQCTLNPQKERWKPCLTNLKSY